MSKRRKSKRRDYREAGLAIGLIFSRYFIKTDYLHYGYWPEGLEVNLPNMAQAQENYNRLLLTQIPDGVKTILDVGCGSGRFARQLLDAGYSVDCVSPSQVLTQNARELLGEGPVIFNCRYEDLKTDKRYDLVLFSESFQYMKLDASLGRSLQFLNDGGYLLIADFFNIDERPSPIGGGHVLALFNATLTHYPYTVLENRDITRETAPTLDLVGDFMAQVGLPVSQVVSDWFRKNRPTLFKILRWIYRKRIAKLRRKYFSGARSAATFTEYKSYRLILLQKGTGSTKS